MAPGDTKKEFDASAIVTTGSEKPDANSTSNSVIRVSDLTALVNGDAQKYIPKAKGINQQSTRTADNKKQSTKSGRQNAEYSFEHIGKATKAIAQFRQSNEYESMTSDQRAEAINEIMNYFTKVVDENEPGIAAVSDGGQRTVTIKGTGAAEGSFSGKPAYNATLSEDNSQADRRDDVRPMELPRQDINGDDVSAVTGNVYGSKITPDDFASLIEEPTANGDFTYAKISNDRATQMATETIASAGTWENA